MTICEFFKNQYDEAIEKGAGTKYVCCINQETAPKGSWEWVKISADYFSVEHINRSLKRLVSRLNS